MHNGRILKHWGSLAALSEFPGEHINGILQNMNTSGRKGAQFLRCVSQSKYFIEDLDLTMLYRICRQGRLDVFFNQQNTANTEIDGLARILYPVKDTSSTVTPTTEAEMLAKGTEMSDEEYRMLTHYLKAQDNTYLTQDEALHQPRPLVNMIIPRRALHPSNIKIADQPENFTKHSYHQGNSYIQFSDPSLPALRQVGFIEDFWELPINGHRRTFLLVRKLQDLPFIEQQRTPYHLNPQLETMMYNALPSNDVGLIEAQHLITQLATWTRNTAYGINHPVLVVSWALNRGRR